MPKEEFQDILHEALDQIDRQLAEQGILPSARPTQAAIAFVRLCVIEVSTDGGKTSDPPGDLDNIMLADWFKPLLKDVTAWYRDRYGAQMDVRAKDSIDGVIPVFGTPFALRIPTVVRTPGKPGKTVWLQFPDQVLADEDSLSWLQNGPNLANAPRSDALKARRLANEVAGALRFIRASLMGVEAAERFDELRAGILPHLERAAEQIVGAKADALKRAHWDIQMACELALKALSQQRSGAFKETHDLFRLYDNMPGGPPAFSRNQLSKLPNWERMAELRYGRGARVTVEQAFRAYRAALKIVSGTMDGLKGMKIGQARFEIGRPPWLTDE